MRGQVCIAAPGRGSSMSLTAGRSRWLDGVRRWARHHVVPILTGSRTFSRVAPRVVPRLDRWVHRLTDGRTTFSEVTAPTLVLTTTGHRSAQPRSAPLACVVESSGSWLVVGSNFGRERHPAWTTNLMHDPRATVSHRGPAVPVTATLLTGAERAEAWAALNALLPVYDRYEDRSGRQLRVFRLTPT